MTYNLTNFTSSNDFLGASIAADQLVGGWLFILVIALVYLITFIGLKRYETKYALLTSSFVTLLLTATLWAVGVVGEGSLVFTFVVFLFSLIISNID